MNDNNKDDIWLVSIPILSISCPYSGQVMSRFMPLSSELIKDRCHNPANVKWMLWTYPKCEKDSCPIKVDRDRDK